jgi:hypothetical protein
LISVIKRVFRSSDEKDHSFEKGMLPEPAAVNRMEDSPAAERWGYFAPYDTDVVQQQAELIRAAIAHGGRFGDREIPIPWLRRILAGLEGSHIDEEAMWEGIASPPRKDPVEESAAYQALFPSPG